MSIEIKSLVVGPLEVNCYLVSDSASNEALIVDPGDEPDRILEIIGDSRLNPLFIVCTHAHFDHVGAIPELKEATGAKIAIHEDEKEVYARAKEFGAFWGYQLEDLPDPDLFLKEGDVIKVGPFEFKVMHTPGHSPGCICLHGEGVILTGDTLFAGSVGRTDFPGGSMQKLKESFRRLLTLPDETRVFPGHGPETNIKREKTDNFFVSEL